MNPAEPHVVVSIKLAQSVVDYLKQRPFQEVAPLIEGLVRCPRAEIQAPAPTLVPEEKKST